MLLVADGCFCCCGRGWRSSFFSFSQQSHVRSHAVSRIRGYFARRGPHALLTLSERNRLLSCTVNKQRAHLAIACGLTLVYSPIFRQHSPLQSPHSPVNLQPGHHAQKTVLRVSVTPKRATFFRRRSHRLSISVSGSLAENGSHCAICLGLITLHSSFHQTVSRSHAVQVYSLASG